MSQNTSSAVMSQRVEAHDSLDDFPTQPWATRALIEHVIQPQSKRHLREMTCWEPACNRGHMAKPLRDAFGGVYCTDVHHYGWDGTDAVLDFLWPGTIPPDGERVDWVITNPPFRLAEEFIRKGLLVSRQGVAVIVRTAFLESVGRYKDLFSVNPPSIVAQFTERVPMVKGRLTATGSTATAYCWLIWDRDQFATQFRWIPPCRRQLERPGDYPDIEGAA